VLPDASDRILATSITADWAYSSVPEDTSAAWEMVRGVLLERFFEDWSASAQHQGYLMGEAVLEAVAEISSISFRLPNQHHLPFDLTRFGVEWEGTVFHPVSEPYGDIYLTVTR
jgi:urate oxidase